jgi:hypothetical protein
MAKRRISRSSSKAAAPTVPPHRTCGAMEVHHRLLEQNPQFRVALAALETATQLRLTAAFRSDLSLPVTIPIVVHVVYASAAENVSDAQVQSQIVALNKDYGAKNPDRTKTPAVWAGLVSDTGVQFKLATIDPNGKPTNGITRTKTTQTSFSNNDSVKSAAKGGADAWPSDKYLNLWVCTLGNGLLGYAQFPGGPAATDGVVILNAGFGTTGTATSPYNLGRSATHEIGHWLNLIHIWGDTSDCTGSDFVADTPNAQNPNYGKPTFPHVSCTNGPNGDMFMNYMDYVDDDTMFMFTAGQVARMHATLAGPRAPLVASAQLVAS